MTGFKKAVLAVMSVLFLTVAVALVTLAVGGELETADQVASVVGAIVAGIALIVSALPLVPPSASTPASAHTPDVKAVNGTAAGNDVTAHITGNGNRVALSRRRRSRGVAVPRSVTAEEDGIAAGSDCGPVIHGDNNTVS
ncbi:hypothetical protein [Streptomyces erythrochromogenes]|uniref:hypothetical protein n=1 Tax=Streptomyces erythrochromogenes TaxID=285574 RepID=UPI00386800AD|nr:hypothetical protein OG489_00060 [Streptomyces erythrochromogenes]WSR88352.1 hypothetical protein OG489_39900 [Streptomyces erythrochromogenes]